MFDGFDAKKHRSTPDSTREKGKPWRGLRAVKRTMTRHPARGVAPNQGEGPWTLRWSVELRMDCEAVGEKRHSSPSYYEGPRSPKRSVELHTDLEVVR
uniref:Uncharacterized protein n=1 Tax=Solanum tuberosum TaxID=4113 RepID=M1DYP5_SOLTU